MEADTPYRLDDKYTNGVWYDVYNGDFATIQENDTLVELVNPENDSVYWDMPVREWSENEQHDFVRVPDDAVDDPVDYINRATRILARNDINELSGIPMSFEIGLKYARERTKVVKE